MKTDWVTKGLLVFVGSGLWAMALMHGLPAARAQTSAIPDVIKAHKFELIDAQGKARAKLYIDEYGPVLALNDAKGKHRAVLYIDSFGGTDLAINNANGEPRAVLKVLGGSPELILYDANGNYGVVLDIRKHGPDLDLCDANGNDRAVLSVDKDGPGLDLLDANGNDRAVLGSTWTVSKVTGATNPTAPSTITLFDKNGSVLYQRP